MSSLVPLRLEVAKAVMRWPAGAPQGQGGRFREGTGTYGKGEGSGGGGAAPKFDRAKVLATAAKAEARLFGGDMSSKAYDKEPAGSPKRKTIEAGRLAYNSMRQGLGMPMVFDWSKAPAKTAQWEIDNPGGSKKSGMWPEYTGAKFQGGGKGPKAWGSAGAQGGADGGGKWGAPKQSKDAKPHPKVDDDGKPVTITNPTKPTGAETWSDPKSVATFTPGGATPKTLNGVPLAPWKPTGNWATVPGQKPKLAGDGPIDPPMSKPYTYIDKDGKEVTVDGKAKSVGAGVIVEEPDGRVWIVHPTNQFGGYKATFPKGTVEQGLSLQASAIKEAWEESGLKVEITGVFGDYERTTSYARYYTAKRVGGTPADMGWESQAVSLVPAGKVKSIVNMAVDRDIWDDYEFEAGAGKVQKKAGGAPEKDGEYARWPAGAPGGKGGEFAPKGWRTEGSGYARSGGEWKAIDGNTDPGVAARIAAMKIPPAWTRVRINPDPDAALQAVGYDTKGREQRRYSAEHSAKSSAEKFSRIRDFNAIIPKIREAMIRDLNDKSLPEAKKHAAAALYLISITGFRPGSDEDTGAATKAYGATNLLRDHVTVRDARLAFSFTGKKGVHIEHEVADALMAKWIRSRKKGQPLFETSDSAVRDYLKTVAGEAFKVKDFRTWHGTALALKEIAAMPKPNDEKEYKAARLKVAKAVASHLGNTPTVALESYISPEVWGAWKR